MQLSDLCQVCLPETYNPNKYDEYGDLIKPKLCEEEIIKESVISSVIVQEIKAFDKMLEANESVFTTKNKLYCGDV